MSTTNLRAMATIRRLVYKPTASYKNKIIGCQIQNGSPTGLPSRSLHFHHSHSLKPACIHIIPSITISQTRLHHSSARILGIETSCDDTGVAIIDTNGEILAESLYSQSEFHARMGGVNPPIARDLHAKNIAKAVDEAFQKSGLSLSDLSAIAVTTRPGLFLCLNEGLKHARNLAIDASLPLMPIHHMEAHALTPRLGHSPDEHLPFPFLVLLISGGHCILALVRGPTDFSLLGNCNDQAPGDLYDKAARRLKLLNLAECRRLSGGRAIEEMASKGDPNHFPLAHVMLNRRDCNFSFSGLHAQVHRVIEQEEERHGIMGGDVLPNASDISASLQVGVAKHLSLRLSRAFDYCDLKEMLPAVAGRRRLVMSGGVAANDFLRSVIGRICEKHDAQLVCPPAKLCTDNGVMIAWNAIERWKAGDRGLSDASEMSKLEPISRSPLGPDLSDDIFRANLKVKTKDIDALIAETNIDKHLAVE